MFDVFSTPWKAEEVHMDFLWVRSWAYGPVLQTQTNKRNLKFIWLISFLFFCIYIWVCIKYDSIGVFYEFIKLVCRCLLSLCYFGLSPALEKAGEIEIVKLLFCWIFYSPPRKYEYPSNSQSSVEYLKAAAWRLYSRNRNLIRNKAVPAGNQHSRVI